VCANLAQTSIFAQDTITRKSRRQRHQWECLPLAYDEGQLSRAKDFTTMFETPQSLSGP
jgi:hypothetical protein